MASTLPDQPPRGSHRVFVRDAMHLWALSGFVFAQPIFDQLSRHPDFFVARGSEPIDILLLSLLLCLAPPLVLVLVEAACWLVIRRARVPLHLALVGFLLALLGMVAARSLGLTGTGPVMTIAAALCIGGGALYGATRRHHRSIWIPGIIGAAFPALFLLQSPIRQLLVPHEPKPVESPLRVGNPVPIVLVVLDELNVTALMNADRAVDPVRYPSFARLAESATWYPNAVTMSPQTTVALPVILSGQLPDGPAVASHERHPHNLFSGLAGVYDLQVLETQTQLCPAGACQWAASLPMRFRIKSLLADLSVVHLRLLLPDPWTGGLPDVTATWQGFVDLSDPDITDYRNDPVAAFRDFTESLLGPPEETLYFLHVGLPHIPYRYLPSGREYGPFDLGFYPHGVGTTPWAANPWHGTLGYQRYLLQLGYTDKLLGKLLDRLQGRGLFDASLLVVMSDHGVSFTPGAHRRYAESSNFGEILPIPLFVKFPGQQRGRVDPRSARISDILPTIVDVLEAEWPWPLAGASLLDDELPDREFHMFRASGAPPQSFPDPLEAKLRVLERKLELFGSGAQSMFRLGAYRELVGSTLEELPIAGPSQFRVELDQPRITDFVDPDAPIQPHHVTGRLLASGVREAPPGGVDLAIAVNGRIEAVTGTWLDRGRVRFSAMVPEDAVRGGKNEVSFLALRPGKGGGGPTLHAMTLDSQASSYRLVREGASEAFVTGAGTQVPVAANAGLSHLDGFSVTPDSVTLWGWAADRERVSPCERLVVVASGRTVFTGRPNRDRRDVVAYLAKVSGRDAEGYRRSGFHFELARALFGRDGPEEVRVFSISWDGIASEVHYFKGYSFGPH